MDAQDLFGCESLALFGADFSPFDKFEDIPTEINTSLSFDDFSEVQDDIFDLNLDSGTEENVWTFSQRLLSPLSSPSQVQNPTNHPSPPMVSSTEPSPCCSVFSPFQADRAPIITDVSSRSCDGLTLRQLVSAPPSKPLSPPVIDLTSDSGGNSASRPIQGSQSPLYPTPPSSAQASPRKSPFHFPSTPSTPVETPSQINSTPPSPCNTQSLSAESLSSLKSPCQSPASVSLLSPPESVLSSPPGSHTSSLPPSPSPSVCSLGSTEGLIQKAESTLTSTEIKARDKVKQAEVQAKTSRNYRRSLARYHDLDKLASNLEQENGELREKIESLTSEIALVRKNIVLVMAGKMPVS
ncbi:mucin-2-like [Branchiostoma floridae]|uniref:Mucin-2-like n=1 Tax=Branchiostoma floridae TaxID=7739 RepID=A0A9J7KYQ8_BRAFL|nr:mucin-2-like [Branchiostoma floridae]